MKECDNCHQKSMISVDDAGSLGCTGWTHYICSVCLSELDITIEGNITNTRFTEKNEFIKRTKEELENYYH